MGESSREKNCLSKLEAAVTIFLDFIVLGMGKLKQRKQKQ